MGLKAGDLLKDLNTGEARFRIDSLLVEGRSYYIALGHDTHLEEMRVILKAIRYPEGAPDPIIVEGRRKAMRLEMEALTVPTSLLPEPIDWIEVASDLPDIGDGREPVLALEYISGKTLREEVARSQQGLDPRRALALTRELAIGMSLLHEEGYAYRDLNPDHIIVGFDDNIHLVGTGNIARIAQRPEISKVGVTDIWSAPEIRGELSGKFIGARSDVYSLGALLSFMLTGEEPTDRVESPLTPQAYGRLMALKPEGYRLIVARCIQSMAKWRFKSAQELARHLDPEALPTASTRGFTDTKAELPRPFDLNLDSSGRGLNSNLSAGPLISVKGQRANTEAEEDAIVKPDVGAIERKWYHGCLPWLSASILFMMLVALAL